MCNASLLDRKPRKDAITSNFNLGDPIPTGIPGIDPERAMDTQYGAEISWGLSEQTLPGTSAHPETVSFDQWFLFPMKLGMSIALASTVLLVNPAPMANRLEATGIT